MTAKLVVSVSTKMHSFIFLISPSFILIKIQIYATMKIVLIIYAVSWLSISAVYIKNFIQKNGRNKGSWYFHILIFLLAQLILLIVLLSLCEPFRRIKMPQKFRGTSAYISPTKVESINHLEVKRNEALDEFQTIEKQDYSITEYVQIGKKLHAIVKEYKFDLIFPSLDKVNISKEVELIVHDCRPDGEIYVCFL